MNVTSDGSNRAQSNVIGVILLTAVVVILVGGFGAVYLGASGGGERAPLVDAKLNATADRVIVTHVGGESVPLAELEVVVRGDDASERYGLDEGTVPGDGDDAFEPAERFEHSHGVGGGQLEILLVHTRSNAVVERAYVDAT